MLHTFFDKVKYIYYHHQLRVCARARARKIECQKKGFNR